MRPSVTIGIPVNNEEKNIGSILNYLNKSKCAFELKEILVVCSGCTDRSVEIVQEKMKLNNKIRLIIEKERKGKFSAMNKILSRSKGEIIIFVNGDAMPKGNSLDLLFQGFKDVRVGVATGKAIPKQSKHSLAGYFHNLICDIHHELALRFPKMGDVWAVRTGLVEKIPEKILNDDAYIANFIAKTNKIVYQPKSEHFILEKLSLKMYIKERRRNAQGYIQLSKLGMHKNIPLNFLINLVLHQLMKEPERFFYIFLAVIIEISSHLLAFGDIARGKIDYKWERE